MKRKYQGVVVVFVAATVLTAVGVYMMTGLWQKKNAIGSMPRQAIVNLKVPTESQVRQMDRLYDRMHILAAPGKRQVAAKKLSLFGYRGPELAETGKREKDRDGLEHSGFQLSLVVLAGFGRYCIVDGNFMTEGARMDDGTEVLKIESHRVLIARNHERKWIYLDNETMSSGPTAPAESSDRQKGQS